MDKTVYHVNDLISISGGVEVYISQIIPLLNDRGWSSEWIGISRRGDEVTVDAANPDLRWKGPLGSLVDCLVGRGMARGLIHVHNLSDPKIVEVLLDIAPVVRSMHDPRMFCPGQGKFWARSESVCSKPAGLHCFFHAYTERCCNRHPKRLIPAYYNARFEIDRASKRYSRIIANSSYVRDEAVCAGIPPEKIDTLHYFTPPVIDETHMSEGNHILFVGRLSETKGVRYLVESFALVLHDHPDALLDILGDGMDANQIKAQVRALNLEDSITFHGWASRDTVHRFLARASLIAFPSIYPEAFGISGIEAMVHGKPVVAFDVGGVSDWLSHEVTGFMVSAIDTVEFGRAMSYLLSNPETASAYGKAAREIALTRFSPEVHLTALVAIYEKASGLID